MSSSRSPEAGAEASAHLKNAQAPLPHSLFTNPPELGEMRLRFFEPNQPFQLSQQDFETYFAFVDNVYISLRSGNPKEPDPMVSSVDTYHCRIRQSAAAARDASPQPKQDEHSKHTRRKRQKIEETCPMILKVTRMSSPTGPQCLIERGSPDAGHVHDIDYSDQYKRCSAIMNVAYREATKGYTPMSVFERMQAERDRMDEAGGKFMKVSDVRNVSIKWRAQNPDLVLKTYEGVESRPKKRQSRTSAVNGGLIDSQPSMSLPADTLRYPPHAQTFLQEYLPQNDMAQRATPFLTLTYATSLDARLSTAAGTQTVLSGPESKAMTHFLRSRHDGIIIGVGTALADNPGLNCRLEGSGGYGSPGLVGQPRPIIIDPHGRLNITLQMRLLELVKQGRGRAPWIVVAEGTQLKDSSKKLLRDLGGAYIQVRREASVPDQRGLPVIAWYDVFQVLAKEGIRSAMIEGGGMVISELLKPQYRSLISSVIITVAPTFLGHAGTFVAPNTFSPTGQDNTGRTIFAPVPNRLSEVKWQPMGNEDVILCGKLGAGAAAQNNGDGRGILDGIEELAKEGNVAPANGANGNV